MVGRVSPAVGGLICGLACCLLFPSIVLAGNQLSSADDGTRCERQCQMQAQRVNRACLELGGSADECAARAAQAKEQCLASLCAPTNDCGQECVTKARAAYDECVAAGNDPVACGERARALLRECLENNCPPPNNCKRRCARESAEVYRACIELGGSEDECAARARLHFERCVEANCVPPQPCVAKCVEKAREAFNTCRLTSTVADIRPCVERAKAVLLECVTTECPPPLNCENWCVNVSARLYHACRAFGGSKPDCAVFSCRFLSFCLEEICRPDCGGIIGIPCDDGEFCKFPPGECDFADNMGVCVAFPEACPDIYLPVCGCDGVTYSNECEADVAGVSVDHRGPCAATDNGGR